MPSPFSSYSVETALHWIPTGVTVPLVVARIFVRHRLRTLGVDDHLMVVACIFQLFAMTLGQVLTYQTHFGASETSAANATSDSCMLAFYLSRLFGKCSVGMLLVRLMGPTCRYRRWMVFATMALLTLTTVLVVIPTLIPTCHQEYRIYTPASVGICMDNASVDHVLSSIYAYYSAIVDIALSVVPITFLWPLQCSWGKKAFIMFLFGLGSIASVLGMLVAISGNAEWEENVGTALQFLCGNFEPDLVIILGTLPTLVPLFESWRAGKPLTPRNVLSGFHSAPNSGNNVFPRGKGGEEVIVVVSSRETLERCNEQVNLSHASHG